MKNVAVFLFDISGIMPQPNQLDGLPPPDDRIHKCPPGPDRHNIRSATPLGFARAVYEANSKKITEETK